MKIISKRNIKYPMGLERAYAKEIVAHTKSLFTVVRSFVPRMKRVLASSIIAFDAEDDGYVEENALDTLMEDMGDEVDNLPSMRPTVERKYDQTYKFVYAELAAMFLSVFGSRPIDLSDEPSSTAYTASMRELGRNVNPPSAGTAFNKARESGSVSQLMKQEDQPIDLSDEPSSTAYTASMRELGRNVNPPSAGTAFNKARESGSVSQLMKQEDQLEQLKQIWVRENLDLIKSIDAETLRKIREMMADMIIGTIDKAELNKTLIDALEHMEGVEERRAALIGRDQVGKLSGRVNEYLQRQAGITEYVWITVGDERVRPAHAARDGLVFQWRNPPPDGHPGIPIQCRCNAKGVIDMDKIGMQPKPGTFTVLDYEEEDNSRVKVILKDYGEAYIPMAKITRCALNPAMEVHKARAFQSYLGYNLTNTDELIKNILENIGKYDPIKKPDPKGFGERLQITMNLTGPNGKEEPVRTGWIIDKEKNEIRMTSIYVNRKKRKKSKKKPTERK